MSLCWYRDSMGRRRNGHQAVAAVLAVAASGCAAAAANVSGAVVDSITGQPLAGVQVQVKRGEAVLASVTTEADGAFQMLVDVPTRPEPQPLGLTASREGYRPHGQQVTVTAGRPDQLSYRLILPRNESADCVPSWPRTVVVGHVRPPASAARELALSQRIGEVLESDLLAEMQKVRVAPEQQPVVLPCPRAEPRNRQEHGQWARALKADAFVAGAAEPVDQRFRVDLQVSAGHGETALPVSATTPPINLDRPQSADLGRAALAPIVRALLLAYQADGRFAECVEFAGAAQRVAGADAEVARIRSACQAKLPNRGLLPDGGRP